MNRAGRAFPGAPVRPGSVHSNRRMNLVAGLMLAAMIASLCLRFLIVVEPVYKAAVTEDALEKSGARYVLCTRARAEGFDWFAERESGGERVESACRISGKTPLDAGFKDSRMLEDNVFVMYWEGKRSEYSPALQRDVPVYEVTDWTVLAPVKWDFPFTLYKPEKYIVESDVKAEP